MAVDETELSFIRCPNCRSLVPAVATRCRMCGFILKGEASGPSSENGERPSRVRQRTVSVGTEDIENIKEEIEQPEFASTHEFPEVVDEDFDDGDDDEELGEELLEEERPLEQRKRKRRRRKKKKGAGEVAQENVVAANPEEETRDHEPMTPWRESEGRPSPGFRLGQETRPRPEPRAPERAPERAIERPKVEEPRHEPKREVEPEVQRVEREEMKVEPVVETRVEARNVEGQLIGWFISYVEDTKGRSHELRAGKFFVGAERLRSSDFVLAHPSVSTPQCLVVCDPERGVSIQDLMSERGTFVRRAGEKNFERHAESVQLRHGDTVRFGEYEMRFVQIP